MANVLILTFGTRGDVQPYVALGKGLADRGHRVTLSTGTGFDDLISAHGLLPKPLSINVRDLMDTPDVQSALTSWHGKFKAMRSMRAVVNRQLDDMWHVAQEVQPDLILYHPKAFVAPYLARVLGAIAVPSFLQPAFVPTRAFPSILAPPFPLGSAGNRLVSGAIVTLAMAGLTFSLRGWLAQHPEVARQPRLNPLEGFHPAGLDVSRLHAHSRHLVPKPADWADREAVTGYWFLPPTQNWEPPPTLRRFLEAGPPPVYIGFGSMPFVDTARLNEVIRSAVRRTGTRVILATGWGTLSPGDPQELVHEIEGAPHDWLFPRCRAVVHHGGAGTTHEALRAGRPSLVCPFFGDQGFWGARVRQAGCGPAPIPVKKLTAARFADALYALQTQSYAEAAEELGQKMRAEGGIENGADRLNAMLAMA
ncbi:glycosyltransferase [Roseobacter sp. MH60115]|uniref:glycosyltransferase n=1 Tax=Roseobacter sp. MH60115 TaxID=2785324 RepID=UPI0018A2D6BF|nr:glycosyltransferase [Roseobacter sp. MH60115]